MSDNEAEVEQSEYSGSEKESSINEDDLIEDNKDYNSGRESETDSDDEKKEIKKTKKKESTTKKRHEKGDNEIDEDEEIDAEEDEDEEIELDIQLIEKANLISQKSGIIIDPRQLETYVECQLRLLDCQLGSCNAPIDEENELYDPRLHKCQSRLMSHQVRKYGQNQTL